MIRRTGKTEGLIGLLPDCRQAVGGPASFQRKFAAGIQKRNVRPCYSLNGTELDALLLINGTRHVPTLVRAIHRGVPLVQRLGTPFPSSRPSRGDLAGWARIWLRMKNVAFVRSHLAHKVIYQSRFAQRSWDETCGVLHKPTRVVYNGVDVSCFCHEGEKYVSKVGICVVSVEGTQPGPADHPGRSLAESLILQGHDVELLLFGKCSANTANLWNAYPFSKVMGVVPSADLPFFYRGATLFVSADVIAACPNSVIEALACGTPVLGYDCSVLPEMLDSKAGRLVPPAGDPWKNEPPGNLDGLTAAALEIIEHNESFRTAARKLAEERYDLDRMVDDYLDFLLNE